MLGLEINNKKTPENIAYVNHLLEQYDLAEFKSARPSQLSGGMRQRAALIRSHRRESSVDLPQPDGPTIDVKLPGFISKERSLIITFSDIFHKLY